MPDRSSILTSIIVKERFTKVYNEYADSIFRFCVLKVSDRETAIDLSHDIFVKYWDSLSSGTEVKSDKAFLFTITRNTIIDWYRKKKTISIEALSLGEDETFESNLTSDDAEEILHLGPETRFVLDKFKELSETSQEVLYLRFVEGLGPKKIAETLKINVSAVSVRLHRGILELRKITGYEIK